MRPPGGPNTGSVKHSPPPSSGARHRLIMQLSSSSVACLAQCFGFRHSVPKLAHVVQPGTRQTWLADTLAVDPASACFLHQSFLWLTPKEARVSHPSNRHRLLLTLISPSIAWRRHRAAFIPGVAYDGRVRQPAWEHWIRFLIRMQPRRRCLRQKRGNWSSFKP